MQHAREAVLVEQALHQRGIADVAPDEGDFAASDQRLEAADIGGIGHGIDHDQPVGGPRRTPAMHQILADEAGASGDQNAVHARPLLVRCLVLRFRSSHCIAGVSFANFGIKGALAIFDF